MKIKKDKFKIYTVQILLLVILFFALFVPNIVNRKILAILILAFAIIINKVIKKRNIDSIYRNQVLIIMVSVAIIYLVGFYLFGLYFGYYQSTVIFTLWSVINYIAPISILIIASEIMRSVLVVQKAKFSDVLTFIIMVLIDLVLYINIYNIKTLEELVEFVGYILFASISCNLLYNYISRRFGAMPIIVYRLITIVYIYIIPIIPNMYIFFKSFLRMIYPYCIYILLEAIYSKRNISVTADLNRKKNIITGSIMFIIMIFVIMLVSCKFQYGILVVGSGSMTGAINKGDAIIYKSYTKDTIKQNDIIIFQKDANKIIHRVINMMNVNGEKYYITKGDANEKEDEKPVTKDKIVGIYKFKIPKLGFMALWLNDIFN